MALLVGISDYKRGLNPEDSFDSLSTMPDLDRMRHLLVQGYGFAEQDVITLKNEEATQQEIIRQFRRHLIGQARSRDSIVLYFTGHGHQVPVLNDASEVDGLDEALVTWLPDNLRGSTRPVRRSAMYLRDDTLHSLLRELARKQSRVPSDKGEGSVTVILDCCNSGTAAKAALRSKGRDWIESVDGPKPQRADRGRVDAIGGWADSGLPNGVVVIAAAQSNQKAYMMLDPRQGSVLTYYLTKLLGEMWGVDCSYRNLCELVNIRVLAAHTDQNVQLEPVSDAAIFRDVGRPVAGSPRVPYRRVLNITSSPGVSVTLDAGYINGVTVGSRYALYEHGTDPRDPKNKVAEAEVVEVRGYNSRARILRFVASGVNPSSLEAARAIEIYHRFEGDPLRVLVAVPKGSIAEEIRGALSTLDFEFVQTNGVDQDSWEVRIVQRSVRSATGDSEKRLFYERPTGGPIDLGKTFVAEEVRNILIGDWRWKRLASLTSPRPGASRVSLEIVRDDAPETVGSVAGPQHFFLPFTSAGHRRLQLRTKGKLILRNESHFPLYISLIHLDPDGDIDVKSGLQPFRPDGVWRVLGTVGPPSDADETHLFRVIATPRPVDLSDMNVDRSVRSKGTMSRLQDLLFALRDGSAKSHGVESTVYVDWEITHLSVECTR